MENKSSRVECAAAIERLSDSYKNLIHVTSDGTDHVKNHPERCFDVGIAESNLINIATGFALKDKIVIVNAISSFMIYNAYLQIRNDLCYQNLDVTMLGIGSGFSYGHLGFSHHSLEDIAVLATLPNMKIYLPVDAEEAAAALEDSVGRTGPSYVRVRSGLEPVIKKPLPVRFDKAVSIREGDDVLLFTYGACIYQALEAAESLKKKNIDLEIVNVNSIGIYDLAELSKKIRKHKLIVTVDEHYIKSGLGSMIRLALYGKTTLPIVSLGVKSEFCKFGGEPEELFKYYGIDSSSIENKILQLLKKK